MKRVLLIVFFIPYFSPAQKNKHAEALFGLKQDTNSKYIKLPPLWRSDFYNLYEVGKYSSYKYLIKEESTYLKIFSRYHRDSLPVFRNLLFPLPVHNVLLFANTMIFGIMNRAIVMPAIIRKYSL